METVAQKAVSDVLAESGHCACQRCHDDTMALVLNQLPSRYYRASSDPAVEADELEARYLPQARSLADEAAVTVHKAPRHDTDESYQLMNYSVQIVESSFADILPLTKACLCAVCVADMVSYALDQLDCKYVCTTRGAAFTQLEELRAEPDPHRLSVFFQAIAYVNRNRRHKQDVEQNPIAEQNENQSTRH